jgi:hypothetical protein
VLVRFIWVIYIPKDGPGFLASPIRSYIAVVLEVLRRWQWNFCRPSEKQSQILLILCIDRLENEHIGNTDQYRATREVPLPYSRENDQDGDIDSVDGHSISRMKLRGSRIIATRDYEPVI